jgi:tRNA(Ile)-lysidine synthase
MLNRFRKFLQEEQVLCQGEKVLLAFSSGLDSVCLARLFILAEIPFGIAHVNFSLRGDESDGDEHFAYDFARQYKLSFYSKRFNTTAYAKEKGISTQMAARELRYAWFNKLAAEEDYRWIATAHHLSDNAETILLNLTRGTGLHGLRGIPFKQNNIIRPLLWASKNELAYFAKKENLIWREDSSNEVTHYKRNFVRHKVIPLLKELNPAFEERLAESIEKLKGAEELASIALEGIKTELEIMQYLPLSIDLNHLQGYKHSTYILHKLIDEYGFNYAQCEDIMRNYKSGTGNFFESAMAFAFVNRGVLSIDERIKKSEWEIDFNVEGESGQIDFPGGSLSYQILENAKVEFTKENSLAYLDADKLGKLKLRNRRNSDKWQPLGLKGKKLLSDYMIDLKIPLNLKDEIPLLVSDAEIAWVMGYGNSEHFKISKDTKRIVYLAYHKKS